MGFPRLNVQLEIYNPVSFGEKLDVTLRLIENDGKQIWYEFDLVNQAGQLAAQGQFHVACCRFPDRQSPFAILIPDFVSQALLSS